MVDRKFSNALKWLASHDRVVFAALLIVVMGTWGFIALAGSVGGGGSQTFDEAVIRSFRRQDDRSVLIGPGWVTEALRNVTALGGVYVLVGINLAVAGGCVVRRKFKALAFVLATVVGGLFLMLLLKEYFARPRPQVVPYLCAVDGSSFPSGHSMMSAIVYLTLGVLLASRIVHRRLKLGLLALPVFLAGIVGVSRVCLGVHYPTDVLAGWTAGLVWATFCWLVAQKLQQKKRRSRDWRQDEL